MMTHSLAWKFHLAAAAAGVIGLAVVGLGAYLVTERLVHQELRDEADRAISSFDADLHYAESQVEPLLRKQLGVQFLPQAVSFYAAAKTSMLNSKPDKATVRLPTTNPTNEADRPSAAEAQIIRTFVETPDLKELEGEHRAGGSAYLTLSRPIVAKPACLTCHGVTGDAPTSLVDVYGSANGFGWQPNEVIGATVVSVPEAAASRRIVAIIATFSAIVGLGLVAVLVMLDFLAQHLIVRPLAILARYADDVSLGAIGGLPPSRVTSRELGTLAAAFDRMRNSLASAMHMLEKGGRKASPEPTP